MFVALLIAVIFASGTAAPVGSVTRPVSVEFPTCPMASEARINMDATTSAKESRINHLQAGDNMLRELGASMRLGVVAQKSMSTSCGVFC
jgi:hypothetical protein